MTPEKQAADLVGLATRLDRWSTGGTRDLLKDASEPIGPLLDEAAAVVRAVAVTREALEEAQGFVNRSPLTVQRQMMLRQITNALALLDKIGTKP